MTASGNTSLESPDKFVSSYQRSEKSGSPSDIATVVTTEARGDNAPISGRIGTLTSEHEIIWNSFMGGKCYIPAPFRLVLRPKMPFARTKVAPLTQSQGEKVSSAFTGLFPLGTTCTGSVSIGGTSDKTAIFRQRNSSIGGCQPISSAGIGIPPGGNGTKRNDYGSFGLKQCAPDGRGSCPSSGPRSDISTKDGGSQLSDSPDTHRTVNKNIELLKSMMDELDVRGDEQSSSLFQDTSNLTNSLMKSVSFFVSKRLSGPGKASTGFGDNSFSFASLFSDLGSSLGQIAPESTTVRLNGHEHVNMLTI